MDNHPASPARWNFISALTPFVGFPCAFLLASLHEGHPMEMVSRTILIFGGISVLGFLFGIVAFTRKEHLWGLTALSLVLNGPGLIGLYYFLCR